MARIAIVIPAFNAERFLAQALESVRAQTFDDWAMVLVDDGSSDGTVDIAGAYAAGDPRIKLARRPRGGVAAARNHGLAAAGHQCEYVIFLDADDRWEKDALAQMLRVLELQPAAAAASGLTRLIDSEGEPRQPGEMEVWGRRRQGIAGNRLVTWGIDEPTTLAVLAYRNCICTPGQMLVRRSVLAAVGSFDPSTSPCEDWDMSLRVAQQGPILFVDRVVLNWRRHDTNASAQMELMDRQMFRVRQKLLAAPELSDAQRLIVLGANRAWAWQLCGAGLREARRNLARGHMLEAYAHWRRAVTYAFRGARGLAAG